MPRHARFALILVAALTALVLSAAVDVGDGGAASVGRESTDDVSFAVRAARVDGSLTRWSGDDRRDSANSERSLRQRLVLFAAVAALLVGAHLRRRGVVVHVGVRRPTTTWWSPHAGRSPPSFSSSIA